MQRATPVFVLGVNIVDHVFWLGFWSPTSLGFAPLKYTNDEGTLIVALMNPSYDTAGTVVALGPLSSLIPPCHTLLDNGEDFLMGGALQASLR